MYVQVCFLAIISRNASISVSVKNIYGISFLFLENRGCTPVVRVKIGFILFGFDDHMNSLGSYQVYLTWMRIYVPLILVVIGQRNKRLLVLHKLLVKPMLTLYQMPPHPNSLQWKYNQNTKALNFSRPCLGLCIHNGSNVYLGWISYSSLCTLRFAYGRCTFL